MVLTLAFGDEEAENFFNRLLPYGNFLSEVELVEVPKAEAVITTPFTKKQHALGWGQLKIFVTSENVFPNFNSVDYAFSFERLDFKDRNFRLPLWAYWPESEKLTERINFKHADLNSKKHFCNYIYSNRKFSAPERAEFFLALNAKKPVIAAGKDFKNSDILERRMKSEKWIEEKRAVMSDCLFSIAFENSQQNGYATEKILDAFISGTIPIYWGDTEIEKDFNKDSFVNLNNFSSFEAGAEFILELSSDPERMLKMINAPKLAGSATPQNYLKQAAKHLYRILDQELSLARRHPRHGRVLREQKRQEKLFNRVFRK